MARHFVARGKRRSAGYGRRRLAGAVRAPAALGDQVQVTAEAFDANGNLVADAVVTWISLDPAVATVDPDGLVEGGSPGRATIRASVDGVQAEAPGTLPNTRCVSAALLCRGVLPR